MSQSADTPTLDPVPTPAATPAGSSPPTNLVSQKTQAQITKALITLSDPNGELGPGESALFETWDEQTCITALAYLEDLREQVHRLKNVPNLMKSSLLETDKSPETYLSSLMDIARDGSAVLSDFTGQWTSEMTDEILQYAARRRAANPDVVPSFDLPEYGWTTVDESIEPDEPTVADGQARTDGPSRPASIQVRVEEVDGIVDVFRAQHPLLETKLKKETDSGSIEIVLPFNRVTLVFSIQYSLKESLFKGDVSCAEAEHGPGITRFITAQKDLDLRSLLNLIAGYTQKQTDNCSRCRKMLGPDWQIPLGRIQAENGTDWLAVHERCQS